MLKNIASVLILVIVFFLWFRYFEWSNIFFPAKGISHTPAQFGIEYRDINFNTQDNLQLNAWFIPAPSGSRTPDLIILLSNGNAGNISSRIEKAAFLRDLGLNIFMYDYRGYGRSQGRPSEEGLYLDGRAAYDYLIKEENISPDNIIAYGESLGAAVTTYLAKNFKLRAIILEGAFTNAKEMAKEIYPFLPAFLIRSRLDNLGNLKSILIPKLFLHARHDEIVPYELAQKLFQGSLEPKFFYILKGQHNSAFFNDQDTVKDAILAFLDNL